MSTPDSGTPKKQAGYGTMQAMIQDITIYIIGALGAVAVLIGMNIGAGIYLSGHAKENPEKIKRMSMMVKTFAFVLFLIIGFSLIPVMVKLFTDALPEIITESALPEALQKNAMLIVYGFWAVYSVGIALAFPAMKKSGFFDPELPNPPEQPKS